LLAKHKACRVGQKNPTPATPRTKNAQIAIYKAMSAWAIRRRLIGRDPFLGLEKVKEVKEHREVYTIAEIREMVADHRRADEFFPFVMLAVMTGARSETLRSLTWGMIDRENKRIKIPGALLKASLPGQVPLQLELVAWLDAIRNGFPSAKILPKELANISSDRANEMMQAYLIRCGIDPRGRSVHCIRHSVAGLLTATEMSAFAVMDALCHRNIATSKHYAALADNYRVQVQREKWPMGVLKIGTGRVAATSVS
jgi:integrase